MLTSKYHGGSAKIENEVVSERNNSSENHDRIVEELNFVLFALRSSFRQGLSETAGGQRDIAAQRRIFTVASENKIVKLTAAGLSRNGGQEEHGWFLEAADGYSRTVLGRNLVLLSEVAAVMRHFTARQIPATVMKGPLQQKILYGDFFIRPAADIDILVAHRHFRKATDALLELQYEQLAESRSIWWRWFLGEQHLVRRGDRPVSVDLHHRVQQPGSPAPADTRAFLSGSEPVAFRSEQLPALSREDVPLLSAISIVKALYNREAVGSHICDLYRAVGFDTAALASFLARAEKQDIAGTAFAALRIVSIAFDHDFGDLQPKVASALKNISDEDLLLMTFVPAATTLVWPKRRQILWALCAGDVRRYLREACWVLTSEACRRLVEPAPPSEGAPGT